MKLADPKGMKMIAAWIPARETSIADGKSALAYTSAFLLFATVARGSLSGPVVLHSGCDKIGKGGNGEDPVRSRQRRGLLSGSSRPLGWRLYVED